MSWSTVSRTPGSSRRGPDFLQAPPADTPLDRAQRRESLQKGPGNMDTAAPRRTLIVANRTASTPLLVHEVERRAAERPTQFALLIPNVSSRKAADWTLETALRVLRWVA